MSARCSLRCGSRSSSSPRAPAAEPGQRTGRFRHRTRLARHGTGAPRSCGGHPRRARGIMPPIPDLAPQRVSVEADLAFEMGGPAYRLMQRVGVIKGVGPSILRRCILFVIIGWVPLLVL